MVDHVGKSLKAFLAQTAIKPSRLLAELSMSEETMYRHFRSKDLHSSILRKYEQAFRKLKVEMSIAALLDENNAIELPMRQVQSNYQDTAEQVDAMARVSQLLHEAAETFDRAREQKSVPQVEEKT